ncbi:glycerol-3-phosphate responsive antiterminator [Brevibacillus daliensis]|uniref:glycerol-3-phosphate responsive antiterminator n=1 Tax=Brevibacillus daliensis TaxID=2892995 RepID=UPI001E4BCE48|nr:glycerol-3-phosphate responsive antiterminator [Brevibacillus daliensis]
MKRSEFYQRLKTHQIIASVKEPKSLERALHAPISAVVLSIGNLGTMKRYVDLFVSHQIPVFLHLERMGGISFDREGMAYIGNIVKPTGIVTTRNSLIKLAKKHDLLTIQRLFLVDSDSVSMGLQSVKETLPDALEIMPALLPEQIKEYSDALSIPIIAGGLIRNIQQIETALSHNAIAVSTGTSELWHAYSVSKTERKEEAYTYVTRG